MAGTHITELVPETEVQMFMDFLSGKKHWVKIKVKLFLCYLIKHYAMKAYGGVDV
jgi:hypothetical protein